ncbi:MAG: LamG-like jellyroll fold domain-containing protein [Planctomycetota bacterium]
MSKKLTYLFSFVLALGPAAGVANADLAEGLVAYWPLDDGGGTTAIDVVGGHHGTLINGPTWTPPGDFKMGTGALKFDGTNDVASIQPFDVIGGGITLAAWMKPDSFGINDGRVISKANEWLADDHWWMLSTIASGGDMRLRFRLKTNDGQAVPTLIATSGKLVIGEWHHWAATWDGTTMRLYSNTQEAGSIPKGGTAVATDPTVSVAIGSQPPDAHLPGNEARIIKYFDGVIDDVAVWNRALTPEELNTLWNDGAGTPIIKLAKASNPRPSDEAEDVPRDVVLSWTPGIFAPPVNGHKVYLSESFNDVNDGVGGVAADANSYAPGRLDFGTTYYWRVDEVNGAPDYTVHQGDVWSFTTELLAYPIENITVTASSCAVAKGPENTINGSGLDESGLLHGKEGDDTMWLSDVTGPQPSWIEFQFDKVYKLHELWVWNSNESLEQVIGFGFKDVTIEYSVDGTNYTTLGTTHEFARGPGAPDYAHNTTVDMGGVGAKHVRFTANSNWGGIVNQYGLSEVRFLYVPVQAREPRPADGETDVSIGTLDKPMDVILGFRAGREAATHNVYFSSDEQAVAGGTVAAATVTETSHGPLSLDLGKTYYWRVDEVNEAEILATWQGDLWSFTTQEYFVVDDFESYNDLDPTDPNSNRIFNAWIDGYEQPTNGSLVGYENPPFTEQTVVHGDKQAMPLFYDNSGTARYSEATLTLTSGRDWTVRGAGVLSLWFKGNPAGFVEDPVGTYTMTAAGVDIWGTADEFRYAWKQLSGDGEISATVQNVLWVPGSGDWSKAGVMIRGTLEAGSPNAFVALTTGSGDGATFQWRTSANGSSSSSRTLTGISPPASIKLVRSGNILTGYVFQNGQWQQQGRLTIVVMQDPVYIGLALTSHSPGVTTTAVFTDVQTTGAVTGVFTEQAIGIDMPSNTPESMYVAVASSGGTPVEMRHDDPAATQIGDWTEWNIPLTDFSDQGVVLTNINTISIGIGDKASSQPGGSGIMYFDDIRLYPLP